MYPSPKVTKVANSLEHDIWENANLCSGALVTPICPQNKSFLLFLRGQKCFPHWHFMTNGYRTGWGEMERKEWGQLCTQRITPFYVGIMVKALNLLNPNTRIICLMLLHKLGWLLMEPNRSKLHYCSPLFKLPFQPFPSTLRATLPLRTVNANFFYKMNKISPTFTPARWHFELLSCSTPGHSRKQPHNSGLCFSG